MTSFRSAAIKDLGFLRSFLGQSFSGADQTFTGSDLMEWKYFAPHPFWAGPRSRILEKQGRLVAHAGLAPVSFLTGGAVVSSAQLIDWAADIEFAGAGVQVFSGCRTLADTVFTLGGSDDSRRVFPHLKWLRRMADVRQYARPLRPLRQVMYSKANWKSPARAARNFVWSRYPPVPPTLTWSCQRTDVFDQVWQWPPMDSPVILRTADWLNYLLRCPTVSMEGYVLRQDQQSKGHFLLARVGPQARLVDFVVASKDRRAWANALAVVIHQAAADPKTLELAAGSSILALAETLETGGFRCRGTLPLYMADPNGKLHGALAVEITLGVGDEFYSHSPGWPMWT